MSAPSHHGHLPAAGPLRRSRHASPRLDRAVATCRRLRAAHRHVLPSRNAPSADGEAGFSTAELLGNAALGIAALVAIWVVLEALGVSVVSWIGAQIGVSG